MPMKKGSAATVVSRHIRGSIEAISKIKRFTISSAKIIKKRLQGNKTTRQQVLFACCLVVLLTFRMEDRHRRNLDLAFQGAVDSFEPVVDS